MANIKTNSSYKKVASFIRSFKGDTISISSREIRSLNIDGVPFDSLFYRNCLRVATIKMSKNGKRVKLTKTDLGRHVRKFYNEKAQARLINDARVLSDEEFNKKYVTSKEEVFNGTNKILSTKISYETDMSLYDFFEDGIYWEEF